MMKNVVESLDNGLETNDEESFAILMIERELGELIHPGSKSSIFSFLFNKSRNFPSDDFLWCCRSQRVHPSGPVSHRYSDYLINFARGQMLDKNRNCFLTKQSIQ